MNNKLHIHFGTFQCASLPHEWVSKVKGEAREHGQSMVIAIVPPVTGTYENPLDAFVIEHMLRSTFEDTKTVSIIIRPMNVSVSLASNASGATAGLYPFHEKDYAHFDHDVWQENNADQAPALPNKSFRAGMVYRARMSYAKGLPTVDMALFNEEQCSILLGRRHKNGPLRFPGGFYDPEQDASYEEAAIRELREEADGNKELSFGDPIYVGSHRVDDKRYQGRDKIVTMLFLIPYKDGQAVADDDIDSVEWVKLPDAIELAESGGITPEHVHLLHMLVKTVYKDPHIIDMLSSSDRIQQIRTEGLAKKLIELTESTKHTA